MQGNRDNNIYQFNDYQKNANTQMNAYNQNNQYNQMNDYIPDLDMYEANQDQMDADIKMLYQQSASMDVPDLWNRIEAGFDQEMVTVKKIQKKRTYRMAGLVAAVVLAVVIAIPVLNMNNRTKDDVMEMTTSAVKEEITEATKDDEAAGDSYAYDTDMEVMEDASDDVVMSEDVDMTEDGETDSTVNNTQGITENTAGNQTIDSMVDGRTIDEILGNYDQSQTVVPAGAKATDITLMEGFLFNEEGNMVLRQIYSDGTVKTPTRDIKLITKAVKKYNILQWQGITKDEMTVAASYYIFTVTVNLDGEYTSLYRVYPVDATNAAGDLIGGFAEEFFTE